MLNGWAIIIAVVAGLFAGAITNALLQFIFDSNEDYSGSAFLVGWLVLMSILFFWRIMFH